MAIILNSKPQLEKATSSTTLPIVNKSDFQI
jgi:hypothetical protein